MRITFCINNDSEAELTKKSRQELLDMGDVVALDWVKDMRHDLDKFYDELHDIVFSRPVA
jgi:hypothetical protein